MMKKLTIILFLLVSLSASAQVNIDSIRAVFKDRFSRVMKKNNIAGANYAIVSTDSVLWIENLGYADKVNQQYVTDSTLFALGSVTKVFTAVATMQLNERALIELDQPFRNYLTSFNPEGNEIDEVTVRNILTHHSGLPSDVFKGMFSQQPEDYTTVVDYINKETLSYTPGKIRAYSNPAYSLLGHMISERTGMSYQEYMRKYILSPLNMQESAFNAREQASKTYDSKGEEQKDVLLRDIPAGGLYSNGAEMSRFLMAMLQRNAALLPTPAYERMLCAEDNSAPLDLGSQYALGWNVNDKPFAGKVYYHTGTTLYANAMVAFSPEVGLGIVVLTNSENGRSLFKEANNLLEILAKEKGMARKEVLVSTALGNKKRIKMNLSDLQKHEGIYVTPGAYIKVFTKRNRLYMRIQGIKVELIPVADNTFIPKPILLGFIPIKLNENRMYFEEIDEHYVLTQLELGGKKELLCERIKPQEISNSWSEKIGKYELINTLPGEIPFFHDFSLETKDNLLLLAFKQKGSKQHIEMPLEIMSDNSAKTAGLGRYAGQRLQSKGDIITIFGLELKKQSDE